jgi:uncharacterized coiled-coil protein SlyX
MDDDIKQRFDTIDSNIAALSTNITTLSDRLARQVAVTEALRSDVRLITKIMQAMIGSYIDLSSRVTDLENPLR